ncbi:MAG: hypothetical protein ACI9FG_000266 [Crocinitomicaceae bacterium]|jgi:hypothetical protein
MLRIASFHFTQRYLSLCEMRLALLVLLFCIIIASYRSYPLYKERPEVETSERSLRLKCGQV